MKIYRFFWFFGAGVIAGSLLLLFPLVRSFHLDSAMLAGIAGAAAGAWIAARPVARDRHILPLVFFFYAMALPLIFCDLFRGCLSADGAAFWLFIPLFSILFGFALGRAVRYSGIKRASAVALTMVLVLAGGGAILQMYLFPQIFFFNHVFGYWPGAIYDQTVNFPGRLVLYRTITLAWILLLWLVPHLSGAGRMLKGIAGVLVASLLLNYALAAQNGILSLPSRIQTELGGVHHTSHFSLYYSKQDYGPHEIAHLARLHEFHFRELTDTLKVEWPEGKRIGSYLYGDEWQMQRLTGAQSVSYVPVWQPSPQMHIRKRAIDRTLRHEMVHVIARQFGNRLLNASWSIGLVEGLAVALTPASSSTLTHDQLVVSNEAYFTLEELKRLFSLTGFYKTAGPVAYPVSGSFAATLLRAYPVEQFKEAYRRSSLEKGYGSQLEDAVEAWHRRVAGVEVTEDEKRLAEAVFETPSLFQERCPRRRTTAQRHRDAYRRALSAGDTTRAVDHLEKLLWLSPDREADWMQWMQFKLERGHPDEVISLAERNDMLTGHPPFAVPSPFAVHPSFAGHPQITGSSYIASPSPLHDNPLLRVRVADAYVAAGREVPPEYDRPGNVRQREGTGQKGSTAGIQSRREQAVAAAWERRADQDRWEKLVRILYSPVLSMENPPEGVSENSDPMLVRAFFAEWFRRNPLPAAEHVPTGLVRRALEPPLDPAIFETFRSLIYLASPQLTPAFFDERLSGMDWRPARQSRLAEALRFAGS